MVKVLEEEKQSGESEGPAQKRKPSSKRAAPRKKAPAKAPAETVTRQIVPPKGAPEKKEGIPKSEVQGLLACISDLDRKLDSSRKVLESMSAQLGALSRLGFTAKCGPESVVPRLVEIHNHLSNIHQSLEESFESVRTRYSAMKEKCTSLTAGAATAMDNRRKLFEDIWKRIRKAGRKADLMRCLREENMLFGRALDDYSLVLGAVASMRDVDNRVNEVFNDFSETIGRIDGLSRAVSEFISEDDTRAFEEEEERMKKTRAERVGQYIR